MSLTDAVKKMRASTQTAALQNELAANHKPHTLPADNSLDAWQDNPKLDKIRGLYTKFTDAYWEQLIAGFGQAAEKYRNDPIAYRRQLDYLGGEMQKKECIYHAYGSILANPWQMDDLLAKLKKDLARIEKETAQIIERATKQISL